MTGLLVDLIHKLDYLLRHWKTKQDSVIISFSGAVPLACCDVVDCYQMYCIGCARNIFFCEVALKVTKLIIYAPIMICCPQRSPYVSWKEIVAESYAN